MIAPTVRDAKVLLKFAFSRGLLIGRDPIVIVAAVVIVVARLHGVRVTVERAAQASRVQAVSVRKRLKELLGEIITFCKQFPWGEDMSMKRLDDYLPIAFKFIATAELSKEKLPLDVAPPASLVDGLPPAYRAAHAERSKVLESIKKVRDHSVAATDPSRRPLQKIDGGFDEESRPVKEEPNETGVQTNSSDSTTTSKAIVLTKPLDLKMKRTRATRGGGRTKMTQAGRKKVRRVDPFKPVVDKNEEPDILPFGLPEDKELGWQEVMLHGLLLAGVPERLLSTEMKPLDPSNKESVFEAGEIFSKAMAERSVDPLLHETDVERIEREDALAIEAIDDDELDYMFRTNEEMEVVRLLRAHEENVLGAA
jgi:hypothetical protein